MESDGRDAPRYLLHANFDVHMVGDMMLASCSLHMPFRAISLETLLKSSPWLASPVSSTSPIRRRPAALPLLSNTQWA